VEEPDEEEMEASEEEREDKEEEGDEEVEAEVDEREFKGEEERRDVEELNVSLEDGEFRDLRELEVVGTKESLGTEAETGKGGLLELKEEMEEVDDDDEGDC
jgi:hypothetical protein